MKVTPETSGFTFTFYSSDLPGEPQVTVIVKIKKNFFFNLDGTHTKNKKKTNTKKPQKPIGLTSSVSIPGKQKMGSAQPTFSTTDSTKEPASLALKIAHLPQKHFASRLQTLFYTHGFILFSLQPFKVYIVGPMICEDTKLWVGSQDTSSSRNVAVI